MQTPFNTPPTWAPHAVATTQGWVDPATGEILVASRYLDNPIPHDRVAFAAIIEQGGLIGDKAPTPEFDLELNHTGPQPLEVIVTVKANQKPVELNIHWGDGSPDSNEVAGLHKHEYLNVGECTLVATAKFENGHELVVKKLIKIQKPKAPKKTKS